MNSPEIEALRRAILHLHGCESVWVDSVPVQEFHEGQLVWEGIMDVFDLRGHATASRAYAWSHAQDRTTKRRYVAVLHIPPVDSPQAAVRASIVEQFRTKE